MKVTYRQLAGITGINISKLKRHGRKFLKKDDYCGQRCGYARELEISEAWILYVTNILYKTNCQNIETLINDIPPNGMWCIKVHDHASLYLDMNSLNQEFLRAVKEKT